MDEDPESGRLPLPGLRTRILLSVFIVLHWGSVAAWILPGTKASLQPLPRWIREPAAAVFPPYVHGVWPVAGPYLDLTATRQNWMMFAPTPANWVSTVEVVAYFPVGHGRHAWLPDTLVLRGGREVPYPHLLHHRSYRILYNLGYKDWGAYYRPIFAREMCREIRDAHGDHPAGVVLRADWARIRVPWEAPAATDTYYQRMGGYSCGKVSVDRAPWRPYGIPDSVSLAGLEPVAGDGARLAASTTPGPASAGPRPTPRGHR